MKLTKCDKTHYYDADKYHSCPHCDKRAEPADGVKTVVSEKPGMEKPSSESPKRNTLSPRTGSIWDQSVENKTANLFQSSESSPVSDDDTDTLLQEITPEPPAEAAPRQEQIEKPSLQAQINAVAAHGPTEDVKTMAIYNFSDSEPVVGWLVCVKGAYIGQSFNLKTGRNNIGRAMNMDVPLAQEPSVSRNIHAVLTYEPQKRAFYLQAGESSGLTYLNDELVMSFVAIKAYDRIRIGGGEFIFIPFCGENFTWDEYTE
jgi:hypothetical protein